MQYGPRILWGDGCAETNSGQHLVEFNEFGTEATCCQCGLSLEGEERYAAWKSLPTDEQSVLFWNYRQAIREAIFSGDEVAMEGRDE